MFKVLIDPGFDLTILVSQFMFFVIKFRTISLRHVEVANESLWLFKFCSTHAYTEKPETGFDTHLWFFIRCIFLLISGKKTSNSLIQIIQSIFM